MNKKETAELRRRYTLEKNEITSLRGCYVNERKEIISCFDCSLNLMPEEEAEKYLAMLKKVLSGTPGKTAADIAFSTHDVTDSPEHKLLSELRSSGLKNDEAVKEFFAKIIGALNFESDYLILIAHDAYDVISRGKDGAKDADSTQVFRYINCAVCPVKPTKPLLCYTPDDGSFHNGRIDSVATAPALGFMFPTFDDRAANIYNALYYTADTADSHPEFVDAVFGTPAPVPVDERRETFQTVIADTVGADYSLEVAASVREQIAELIENHEADKSDTTPLTVSKREIKELLTSSGVTEEKAAAFAVRYEEEFGDAEIEPDIIADPKKLELRTPDVFIKVAPDRADLLETRVIDGVKYLLIRADENVEVNGVNVNIQ